VTIAPLAEGDTFEAQLVQDEFHMLWIDHPNSRGKRMGHYLLSAVRKVGWRIARVTRGAGAARGARVRQSETAMRRADV
jgi:hypothetical protein